MVTLLRYLLCWVILLACHHTFGFAEEQSPKRTPPVATSDRVEVNEIRIARVKVSDASPEADLTHMQLSLWIDAEDAEARQFLIRLVKLEPVVDDTGKVLSTKDRRGKILLLKKEVRSAEMKTFRGRHGPVVPLLFDAPSRGASQIKTLKGRIEITPVGREKIVLKDLPSLLGKRIKHDLLAAISIVPRIDADDDFTEVTLEITGQQDRLIMWAVAQDGRPLRPRMQSKSGDDDPLRKISQGYRRFRPNKNTSLLIVVAKVGKKQIIDFEFSGLELP